MTRFERVKQILDDAIGGESIGAHGAFWRPLDLPAFKLKAVFGRVLVVPGDGQHSNLVLALRGQAPFSADSGDPDGVHRRMPAGRAPVPEERIAFISQWIDDGCPDDEFIEEAPSDA